MIREPEQETRIVLGKAPRFGGGLPGALGRVLRSRSPALDWAKGQLVVAAFSFLLLLAALAGVLRLAFPAAGRGAGTRQAAQEVAAPEAPGETGNRGRPGDRSGLRDDLFQVPVARKAVVRKEPKTNPAELLRQIELQGVIGGAQPRAMVLYKNTSETVTVSAGDDLGEFQVVEIRERSVVLKWRDELFELSL